MNKNTEIASISMVTCSKYIKLGSGVVCCLGIDELCCCLLFDRWAEIRCSSTGEWTFFVRLTQVEKPTLGWLCGTNTFTHILILSLFTQIQTCTIAHKYCAMSVDWIGQDLYICTSVRILYIFHQNVIIQHRLMDISNKCTNTVMHMVVCLHERKISSLNDLCFLSNAQWTFIRWKCTNTHSRIHTRTMICSMVTPADALQSTVVRICVIMMGRKAFSKDQYFMCACVRIAALCMYVHES